MLENQLAILLRDISKKFPELIKEELDSWDVKSKEIQQVYKLASKFIKWQLSAIKLKNGNYKIFSFYSIILNNNSVIFVL